MSTPEARFAEIYRRYRKYVASYCVRRVPADEVDDAVSDVFLTVWRRIDDVPAGQETIRWLYGVAYKVVGRSWRTGHRRKNLAAKLESLGLDPSPVPEDVVVADEESRRVLEALNALRAIDREILRLAAWEELGHQEIADVLGVKPDAVRQRFHKAKKRLTREFNGSDLWTVSTPAAQKGGVQ